MPSQNKLIKQGIKYTDSLFGEISKRLEQGVKASDSLESFLDKYHKAFPEKDNPLIALGYDVGMLDIILQETNNHKFSRPSQKELTRVTIENRVGDLIVDVGEDIQASVRDIVKDGYNNNLSQNEIADQITSKVSTIKTKRARAIARTEIARTATISDYVINKEMGATHFYVECRNTACQICKKAWHKGWTEENDATYKPRDKSAGGKGWIGNNVYSMSNTSKLPPIHPNCRCVPYFVAEDEIPDDTTIVKETPTNTEPITSANVEEPKITENTFKITNEDVVIDEVGMSGKGYDGLNSFAKKYANSKIEHGCIIDMITGEQYSQMYHGDNGSVHVPTAGNIKSPNCVLLHNHPDGFRTFSPPDLRKILNEPSLDSIVAVSKEETHIMTVKDGLTPKEKSKLLQEYIKSTDDVRIAQEKRISDKSIEIMNKYKGDEQRTKLLELLAETKTPEYKNLINREMNQAVMKFAEKNSDLIKIKKINAEDTLKYATDLKNAKVSSKSQSKNNSEPTSLTKGQQEYIKQIDNEISKLTLKVNEMASQKSMRSPKEFAMVKGQLAMLNIKKDTINRHLKDKNYSEIPTIKAETTSSSKNYSHVEINGKKYLKWDDDANLPYEEKIKNDSAMSKHYEINQDKANYTEKELYSLLDYQKNSSTDINKLLIYGNKIKETWDKFAKALNKNIDDNIKNIKSAINKTPALQENTILYTGQRLPDNVLDGDSIGTFKHFVSTSFKARIASSFSRREGRYSIKVLAPKGTKGIVYTERWRGKRVNKGMGEGELLLQAGTKFKVIELDPKNKTATIELIV